MQINGSVFHFLVPLNISFFILFGNLPGVETGRRRDQLFSACTLDVVNVIKTFRGEGIPEVSISHISIFLEKLILKTKKIQSRFD